MSVDVFGRKLGGAESNRGPPGVGYKITEDNQYDLENKRLTNVGTAINPDDAVNLKTVRNILKAELEKVHDTLSKLKTNMKKLDRVVKDRRKEPDMELMEVYPNNNDYYEYESHNP